jgi:hypothetical protein
MVEWFVDFRVDDKPFVLRVASEDAAGLLRRL